MLNDTRISVLLPVDDLWLPFARDTLRRYSRMVGFSEALEQMCEGSVMEAGEELIRAARKAGVSGSFQLSLEHKGGAVVIELDYDGRIPLNPHRTAEYEVPDGSADAGLDGVDLDTLWLHLIKTRMDRVRFLLRGSRHVLRMIKYGRAEGREQQAWIMAVRPVLRRDVLIHLDDPEAEYPSSVLQVVGKGALRLGPGETFLIRNMDGEATFHDLYMAHVDALGLVSPASLASLYEQLERADMLATTEEEGVPWVRRVFRQLTGLNLSIPHADRVVTAVHRVMRPLVGLPGLLLLLAVGASGLIPLLRHLEPLQQVVVGLEGTLLAHPLMLVPVYLLTMVHVILHELGHGVVCKHFGGRVPRMGIMFYLASFVFYCDTTAAWNFPQKRQRLMVSLGGPLVSFAVLGVGLWAAGTYAGTGSLMESSLVAFCLVTLLGLLMNFNPFIKMDAYYMLLDLSGVTNLRVRSFRFLERATLGWLGLGEDKDLRASPRERRIFWWYGIVGGLVTVVFFAMPLVRLRMVLQTGSATGGRLLVGVLIGVLLLIRLTNLAHAKFKSLRYREYKIQ